jgi:sugar/nucleoside kinase (ribokinase family)
MNKVNIYGHLIIDKIFNDKFDYFESIGGIANVWDGLNRLNEEIQIEINPTNIGEAIVLVNTENNTRVGKAILNKKNKKIKKVSISDWHHIAYINQIVDIDFIYQIKSGIISVDITKENPNNCLKHLHIVDFLFISKEDLFDDIKNIAKKTKGWVIAHDPKGSIYTNGELYYEYIIPDNLILNNVNVLGAGDFFAASFITEYLKSKDINLSIPTSHEKTTFLLNKN